MPKLGDIQQSVKNRILGATGLLPIKYHHKRFDHEDDPHAELIISPNEAEALFPTGDLLSGYIQFNIYVGKNMGAPYPTSEAQKFLDLFPRGLEWDGIRIIKGTIYQPEEDRERPGWRFTPALIEYDSIDCFG